MASICVISMVTSVSSHSFSFDAYASPLPISQSSFTCSSPVSHSSSAVPSPVAV